MFFVKEGTDINCQMQTVADKMLASHIGGGNSIQQAAVFGEEILKGENEPMDGSFED
jgi:hypothetical protein